jgi:lipopolysaccharide/colanic/teichoic acid biosynthesis glycosyltransferase
VLIKEKIFLEFRKTASTESLYNILSEQIRRRKNYLFLKRVLELSIILIAAPIIIAVLVLLTLLVKIIDKGPAFYIQNRIGRFDSVFKVYKFRTMRPNVDGRKLTLKDDDRITPIGAFLRRYKLDELPQIFNVLKGEMSFVGPRPVPQVFFDLYKENIPNYSLRHLVLPGITGLAQVEQGYTSTLEQESEKLEYDIQYINNFNFRMDLKLLARTLGVIKGIRINQ